MTTLQGQQDLETGLLGLAPEAASGSDSHVGSGKPSQMNGEGKGKAKADENPDLKAAQTAVDQLISDINGNDDATRKAKDRLREIRRQIDKATKPTFWDQMVTHKVLILTIILTVLGMVGSILGLVTGYVAEKDRARYVLAGAVLSLVGNTISSATGIFVPPPTLGKNNLKTTSESKETIGLALTESQTTTTEQR